MQKLLLATFPQHLDIYNLDTVIEFILTLKVKIHTHQTKVRYGPEFRFFSFRGLFFFLCKRASMP